MGVSMTNAEALIVPTSAREPMFGTNPIAVTIPAAASVPLGAGPRPS